MRPRIDAHVASVILAEAGAVAEEVLAGTPSLRARKEGERHACEAEFTAHARALAAAVDLRCPAVFREHAAWAARVHDAAGLPHESVSASLRALAGRVAGMALPEGWRRCIAESLAAGIAAATEQADEAPIELWDATAAALRGNRTAYLAAVEAWRSERGVRVALLGIAEVQRQVGEAWMRHQVTVVEEHRASALAGLGLALLAPDTWG